VGAPGAGGEERVDAAEGAERDFRVLGGAAREFCALAGGEANLFGE
jgi:hypothetical protein